MNFGPRAGFAWTLNDAETTVVRGGVGYLYSPNLIATVRQSAANPFIPFRIIYNRTEMAAKNVKWPMYTDDTAVIALETQPVSGLSSRYSTPTLQVPYTIQSMVSVQHSLGRTMAAEVSYIRTDGNDFPLQRQFTQAFDRHTGVRPNPSAWRAWRLLRRQQPDDGLQRPADIAAEALLERYSWDVNYTFGKSESTQGGDLSAYYIAALREQPGLLGSRIRSRAVQQRHPASAERVVHL